MENKLYPTHEITAAILVSSANAEEKQALLDNASSFIQSQGLDLNGLEVSAVENNANTVNLTLPYYEGIVHYKNLHDSELADVSGGEFFIGIIVMCATGLAVGAASVATGVAAVAQKTNDKNLDGSPK